MRISFDMDGTLVGCESCLLTERGVPWFLRPWFDERLRCGTVSLLNELIRERQCEIWIYTTSERSALYLKLWFRALGIRLGGVVNQAIHDRAIKRSGSCFSGRTPTKYPPLFGISLHVDDSLGVYQEGNLHGFEVLVVSPDDPAWAVYVLEAVAQVRLRQGLSTEIRRAGRGLGGRKC